MKFYIATKFENQAEYNSARSFLEAYGHTITFDWTKATRQDRTQAELDLQGVKDCEVLLGLFEKDLKYTGAIAEVGMALALDKKVIIIGNKLDNLIFKYLPNVYMISSLQHVQNVVDRWFNQ